MGNLQQALLPALVGLGVGLFVGWILRRPRAAEPPARRPSDGALEIARLRSDLGRLDARYQRQVEFFVNFPEVVKALTAAMSIEQVTATCSRGISALLQTHSVAVWLAESENTLRLVDGAGFPPRLRNQLTCTIDELGVREVLKHHNVQAIEQGAGSLLRRQGIAAELAVPIWHGDRLFGLIAIAGAPGDPTTTHRTLAMMADLTGVGLLAASQISKMKQEAENDALTGLANRRTLFRHVAAELSRSQSYGTCVSLAMIDVDHFKHFNDTNGHQAGDEALKLVAKLVRQTTRRTDLVARYGGEEFTVLLLGADRIQATQHAERIRQTIADTACPHGEKQPMGYLSISVGVATAPLDALTRENLFEAADRALYKAKQRGRDRVEPYDAVPLIEGEDVDLAEEVKDGTKPEHAIVRAITLRR